MKKSNLMIVEDVSIIALNIKETLLELGYDVLGIASNIQKAFKLLERGTPDLIIMDIFLKDGDNGVELAKMINEKYEIPIVYLTANSELKTISHAGESSPYGYLVKPFKATDLQSTIELALQRFKQDQIQKNQFDSMKNLNVSLQTKIHETQTPYTQTVGLKDGYMFDREEKILYNGEKTISLTQREKKVMDTLCANVGHVTSIEQIETAAWNDEPAGYSALRSVLFRLRSKLPEGMITNTSGSGYKIHR
ncbi:MAG: DNA-binding response OmpR family regulator [Sulfurimonas sp.]|jgi:DNA-binding response OmpR family regulator|uniref:response regulator transcription factor n=1 Tax=Sulfurimonas sp. TaxID=2022749 RepID=UPI0039E2B355